jgi:hypothetical protein
VAKGTAIGLDVGGTKVAAALVIDGVVAQRLAEARDQARHEATETPSAAPGTALVLRNKEIELRDHYRTQSKARGRWRATSSAAGYSSAARRAGDRAGQQARLGGSPELPGARTRLSR